MKRSLRRISSAAFLAAVFCTAPAISQDTASGRANAIADREEAEERYRRLDSAIQSLTTAQLDITRRLDETDQQLRKVAAEAANAATRASGNFVTREEFAKLVETVREIDRKREADKQQILDRIRDLGKDLAGMVASASRRPASTPKTDDTPSKPTPPANPNQEGAWHTVGKGETLASILNAYNEDFRKKGGRTSMKLVQEANPKLKPDLVYVGQRIFIPFVKTSEK
jgi:LysM repeat protein